MTLPCPPFASLRTGSSRAHRAGRGRRLDERLGSLNFFSSALQSAFDAAGMDHKVELLPQHLRERGGSQQGVVKLVLEQEIDDGVGELVGVSRSGALGNQARQASAAEERLGLI